MTTNTIRTHVLLPRDLVEEVDEIAGPRRRSEFIAEAVNEAVRRRRRREAFERFAGSLKPGDHIPEWDTPESAARWVREGRQNSRDPWKDAGIDITQQ